MVGKSLCIACRPVLTGILVCSAEIPGAMVEHWKLSGNLSEACSCRVPCGCNFGEGPSPHHFCWTIFSLEIRKGRYRRLKLDGLHLAAAHADKSVVWYIDRRATPQQFAALRDIAGQLRYHANLPAFFESTEIIQEVTDQGNYVEIAGHGGFKANYLRGLDRKKPIVVENTGSWNIPHSTKGRTEYLKYSDEHGNKLMFQNTNSNQGKFAWTDKTPRFF